MEVGFVTANLPYPPHSGATIRTYNLLKRLATRHRIHLLAYADPRRDMHKVPLFQEFCASVTPVPWHETKNTTYYYVELLANVLSSAPIVASRFTKPAMVEAVRRLIQTRPLDLLCCDFITLSPNLSACHPLPVHLTAHNVESVLWKRYLTHERNPLKAAYSYLQYRKVLRFEQRALADFQHVACVSQDDLERLRALCPFPQYEVVPNGVDLDYFRPLPGSETPYRLVFTGSMDWRPNQDTVRFFLTRIYPKIKQAEPRASLAIVGREPPAALRALAAAHPDVTLVGTVPDMRPYLASGAVYVVPLRIGGGTRLKILEAMAMGRPVVSTGVGCEGLAVTPERDLLVADDPEGFARAVLRLFQNPDLAARIGQSGHRLVRDTYGWDQIAAMLDETWHKAALGARR